MNKLNSDKNAKYLLPLVLIVWGFFFFRMFKACNPDPETSAQNNVVTRFKAPEIKQKEKFELIPIESDPFLGTAYVESKKTSKESSPITKKNEIPWPNIQYLGMVENTGSKEKIFILNINGQQILIKQKETLQDITVVKGSEEVITLTFQGKRQEFQKI